MSGHQSIVIALDLAVTHGASRIGVWWFWLGFTPVIDVLAVACLGSWLKEWRR